MTHNGDHDTQFDLDFFRETLIESAKNVDSFGKVTRIDAEAVGRNASCGDSIVWHVQVSSDGKKITALEWKGEGCIISKAAANAVVQRISEQPKIESIKTWNEKDILETLGLHEISPGREKCLLLGLNTLKRGLTEKVIHE